MLNTTTIPKIYLVIGILAMINYFFAGLIYGDIGFNIGRFMLADFGGWLIVSRADSSLFVSALLGPFIFIIDHVTFKGEYFLISYFYPSDVNEAIGFLEAFYGVLISFVMFVPLAAIVSLGFGFISKMRQRQRPEDEANIQPNKNMQPDQQTATRPADR